MQCLLTFLCTISNSFLLVDPFKPFLVSHLMLTDEALILTEMDEDYININYDYYSLSIAKLAQALFFMACGL